MNINLPNLKNYNAAFREKGISLPLPVVPFRKNGLLQELPEVENGCEGWPWTSQTDPSLYPTHINWPKLTIVTPSYNQGQFLEQTIRAVLLQNYPNLEYIIIDGGSTDESPEIIKKYSAWLSYWQSEKDRGQSHAINLGFSLASGDYNAWINSDDYYLKHVFHLVVNKFLSKKVDFIYGYSYNYNLYNKTFELMKTPPLLDYFITIPSLMQPSCFWSARIHQPVWEELHCAMDFELWLRLVKGNKRKRIAQALSVALVHNDAKTSDPKMKLKWHEDHLKIWSEDAHKPVYDWDKRVFFRRIYLRIIRLFKLI